MGEYKQDNRRIAGNTMVIWGRMLAIIVIGLLCTRFVFQALGASDVGLYTVVGGIIAMLGFLSSAMTATTRRYINIEMGKPDGNPNKVFNICLSLHVGLALVIFLLAEPMIRVFMNDPAILKAGAEMLRWQVSGMVFVAVVLLFTCLYQSTGKPVKALIMSLSRQGVLFLAVFLIATAAAGYSGFLAAQPAADLLSAGLALGLYKAGQEREEQEICTG